MADAIERLYRLSVDATGAVAQLQKLNGSVDAAGAKFDKLGSTLKSAGAALVGAFAVREVIAGFRAIVDSMDDIADTAQRVGVAAEELQALQHAAEMSGSSADELNRGMERLAANLQQVDTATSDVAKELRAFGVTGADSSTQALAKIADAFATLPDGAQKTAIALDIFGKAGARLIPTLNSGSAGLADFAKEAKALGIVIGGPALDGVQHFNDQLDLLGKSTAGLARSFVVGLLPALSGIAAGVTSLTQDTGGLSGWGKKVGDELVGLAATATFLWNALEKVAAGIKFATSMKSMSESIKDFDKAMAAADKRTHDSLDAMVAEIVKASLVMSGHGTATKKTAAETEAAAKAAAELEKRLKDQGNAAKGTTKEIDLAAEAYKHFQEMLARDAREAGASMAAAEKAAKDAGDAFAKTPEGQRVKLWDEQTKAAEKYALTLGDTATQQQIWREMIDSGTESEKAYAREALNAGAATTVFIEETNKGRTELDAFSDGWDSFADALASGSVTVAEAFSGMVKSIIADLLKIWAQRFIIEAIFGKGAGTGGVKTQAYGGVFDRGQVVPFALGGVVSSPTHFRMAGARVGLMGEAGPEAIMPLARTGDGSLGVRASGGGALNVAIHNYTDASVSARRNSSGDLEVLIEQTKKAIAADFRRGGNDIARSAEGAWGLTRGAAAAF
jgi:hypothetical protein